MASKFNCIMCGVQFDDVNGSWGWYDVDRNLLGAACAVCSEKFADTDDIDNKVADSCGHDMLFTDVLDHF